MKNILLHLKPKVDVMEEICPFFVIKKAKGMHLCILFYDVLQFLWISKLLLRQRNVYIVFKITIIKMIETFIVFF